jgi:DnaJ-domain-containing protein 1
MTTPDLYGELGLEPGASPDRVKRAFLRLAAENHPDRLQNRSTEEQQAAGERMHLLNFAWAVLSSETERLLYDQCLAKGYDYERVCKIRDAEGEAGTIAREEEAALAIQEAVGATVRELEAAVRSLEPGLRWVPSDCAEYFDVAIEGKEAFRCLRVHIKVVPTVDDERVGEITRYAKALLDVTDLGVSRQSHSYLLVGSNISDEPEVNRSVLTFNGIHWRDAGPRIPRALLAYASASDEKLVLPAIADPTPDLRRLRI